MQVERLRPLRRRLLGVARHRGADTLDGVPVPPDVPRQPATTAVVPTTTRLTRRRTSSQQGRQPWSATTLPTMQSSHNGPS